MPNDHVLVTGCAGFIGSCVTRQLLAQGCWVIGVDNLNDAYDPRIKEWRLSQLMGDSKFRFKLGDLTDTKFVANTVETAQMETGAPLGAVAHLAARAGVRDSLLDPLSYQATNVNGTINVLDACVAHNINNIVLASTSSLYGSRNDVPFAESDDTDHPLSPYAASKKGAEAILYAYHHNYGLNTTALRFFTVYGPAGRPDMSIYRFVGWILEEKPVRIFGDGLQSRDFTFVEDIADGVRAALSLPGHNVINLGGDHPYSLLEVIRLIESLTGLTAELTFEDPQSADVPSTWADISMAKDMLGWAPTTDLREGLRHTVDWYRNNRALALDLLA